MINNYVGTCKKYPERLFLRPAVERFENENIYVPYHRHSRFPTRAKLVNVGRAGVVRVWRRWRRRLFVVEVTPIRGGGGA